MLNWSSAVTEKVNGVPGAAETGAETVKCVAGALETVIAPDVPVMEVVTVSVPEMVWLPAVLSVAENVPTPLVKVAFAGSVAAPSVLMK